MLIFLKKQDDFMNENENNPKFNTKNVLTIINGMHHQLLAGGIKARGIYPKFKKLGALKI